MKIIPAGYEILYPDLNDPEAVRDIYRRIEQAGRVCYKSHASDLPGSSEAFIRKLIFGKHEAMLEHAFMTVKFTVDRGVSHEIVRHRMSSFAQESTRYCNYSKDKFGNEITVIEPCFFRFSRSEAYEIWKASMENAEQAYFKLLELGSTPQEARAVLPNSLKTELVVTANMREWRHILNLRAAGTTGKPHPQMTEVMIPLMQELKKKLPALFEDI